MRRADIIRAWKDEEYRASLSVEERASMPDNPAGLVDLSEAELEGVGGNTNGPICSAITISLGITAALSCLPNCDSTIGGTCRNFTSGCCPQPPPI